MLLGREMKIVIRPTHRTARVHSALKRTVCSTGGSLPTAAITAVCDLYNDATGGPKNVSGRFELNIAVNGEDTAVKALLEKYELNLTSRGLVVRQDTKAVTFSGR